MSNRSEQPTPRRLLEARKRGEIATGRELPAAAALGAGLATLAACGPWATAQLAGALRGALLSAGTPSASTDLALQTALLVLARVAAPLLLLPAAAAAAVAALQSGLYVSLEPLRFRAERLDPLKGLRRLLSASAVGRVALGIAKAGVALALLAAWVDRHGRSLAQAPRLGAAALWRAAPLASLGLQLSLAALAFGALDLALARRRHRRALMMTRDEVRREAREDEGDPQHRAERRRLHRAALEAGPISKATVVVVNPTHVAVALAHRRGEDEAPRLLAKATGAGAARIRSAARRAGVPVVRDVLLARALFRLAEVGDEIPEALYDATAAVLVHVYGIDGGRP
ncbi:MAG TPA: EscU/YscU/HrcU family type III secretion system export apparatus switch protein [Anaeromyxobacteraceae bacterium]|nr:EscU/YscU/HrcU family type III secretion system export apparatus switch protein [Anaeromyxobacteraceae bacterium]